MSGVCSHGVLLHQRCRECAAPEHAAQLRGVERLREAKLRGAQPVPAQVEALPPIVRVLAEWEDRHGSLAGCMPDEWAALHGAVTDAAVEQSPRQLRAALRPQAAPAEQEALRDVLSRCVAGIDHLSGLARLWEPDHSSGADRRGWVLAQDARDDAERVLTALSAAAIRDGREKL